MVLTNNNQQQTQTTVTTRTTEVPGAVLPKSQTINKEAVVTNVLEKPVLQNVIEQKHVEVHHKPVVQEIHEQKIIEIEKKPIVQNVQKEAQFSQARAETRFEEIGSSQLGEQERLRLSQLQATQAPKIQQQGTVQQVQEQEVIGQVVKQEFIEKHVQPVVTEVREQKVVEEVLHPIVRKVHEAPIVREVTSSTVQPTLIQGTTTSSTLQGSQLRGATVSTTTSSGLGLGSTTTTSSGANAVMTERDNLVRHENKIINKEGGALSGAERSNLVQHEQAVQQVAHNQGLTQGTTTTSNTHRSGFNDPYDDDSQKPGFFSRMKDKLHLGHHDSTTSDKKM